MHNLKRSVLIGGLTLFLMIPIGRGEDSVTQPKLVPLSEFVARLDPEKPDYYIELAYIGNRSAALLTAMAGYLEGNARDERDRELSKKLMGKAGVFVYVASELDLKINKKSPEIFKEQLQKLNKVYMESMRENKLLNNSVMSPMVENDSKAANSVFEIFQAMEKMIKEGK